MKTQTARIRTIPQCLNEIKSLDNKTAVTENFIRFLCKSGQVKHFKSGSKYLVNLDDLINYLNDERSSITFLGTAGYETK